MSKINWWALEQELLTAGVGVEVVTYRSGMYGVPGSYLTGEIVKATKTQVVVQLEGDTKETRRYMRRTGREYGADRFIFSSVPRLYVKTDELIAVLSERVQIAEARQAKRSLVKALARFHWSSLEMVDLEAVAELVGIDK